MFCEDGVGPFVDEIVRMKLQRLKDLQEPNRCEGVLHWVLLVVLLHGVTVVEQERDTLKCLQHDVHILDHQELHERLNDPTGDKLRHL